MEERALLHRIDYKKGTILLDGKEYPLKDDRFPTIDPVAPYELTEEEEEIMERLEKAFAGCEKLQNHMRFCLQKVDYTRCITTIFCITDAYRLERTDL